jgi:hypothetical protein
MIYCSCSLFDEISGERGAESMVRDYELREMLKEVAQQIHEYNANPSTWLTWLTFLLDQLENQSRDVDASNHERFMEMIEKLKDAVHTRKIRGAW